MVFRLNWHEFVQIFKNKASRHFFTCSYLAKHSIIPMQKPSYSLDLNLCDFFMFLKLKILHKHFRPRRTSKEIRWHSFKQYFKKFQRSFDQSRTHWNTCVERQRDDFEWSKCFIHNSIHVFIDTASLSILSEHTSYYILLLCVETN